MFFLDYTFLLQLRTLFGTYCDIVESIYHGMIVLRARCRIFGKMCDQIRFGSNFYFSSTYACEFHNKDAYTWKSAQHYYPAKKAVYFADGQSEERIKSAVDAFTASFFGRRIKDVDANKWRDQCVEVMYEACMLKFKQNKHLAAYLRFACHNLRLSSEDLIWGSRKV